MALPAQESPLAPTKGKSLEQRSTDTKFPGKSNDPIAILHARAEMAIPRPTSPHRTQEHQREFNPQWKSTGTAVASGSTQLAIAPRKK
jgi:hypothetical protein